MNSASGVLTYKPPAASALSGLSTMTVNYRITATFTAWPVTTTVGYLTITLNNVCMTTKFTAASTQNSIYYEDGSNAAQAITAFTFTLGTLAATDCAVTHTLYYMDPTTGVYTTTAPAFVTGPNATTLALTIQTAAASIATPGDSIASRWIKRVHFNPYSNEYITQEFQIFFVKSVYCKAKTASLIGASTLVLTDYVVGAGARTEPAQFNTNSGEFVTTANDASHCKYTATCGVWDISTQAWVLPGSWSKGGITCDTAGVFTVNIPTTNTNYNPNFTV